MEKFFHIFPLEKAQNTSDGNFHPFFLILCILPNEMICLIPQLFHFMSKELLGIAFAPNKEN